MDEENSLIHEGMRAPLRSAIVPRWIAFLGYALGAILLLSIGVISWISLVFPLCVFLISVAILLENPGRGAPTRTGSELP